MRDSNPALENDRFVGLDDALDVMERCANRIQDAATRADLVDFVLVLRKQITEAIAFETREAVPVDGP